MTRPWLLSEGVFSLWALGRLEETREPMRVGTEIAVERKDWKNAAISYGNPSELQLTFRRVNAALPDAARSVAYPDPTENVVWRVGMLIYLADALHQHGEVRYVLDQTVSG